ncbi:TetR family transcriptional regulator [Ancylobacter sp. G4_0304]|uniref:TetR family transcriptional regulator n=1 Tax=Ancylobacter sp. G4_0304 TaxID=3114289 RepID=UPI0039C6F2F5
MPKLGMEVIRRRQVIDAVVSILANQGWRDLTIRELSDVAGVSAGVITHYFANKRAIIIDAISDTSSKFARTINKIERRNSTSKQRLQALVELMTRPEAFELPGASFWIALYGRLPFDQIIQAELQRLQRWLTESVESIVSQGLHAGDFSTDIPAGRIAASFVTMALGGFMVASAAPSDADTAQRRDMLLDLLEAQLRTSFSRAPLADIRGAAS